MLSTEVPYSRRLLQCCCAIFWCLLSGGPIFGFAALKPILVVEHVYEGVCDISINSTVSNSMTGTINTIASVASYATDSSPTSLTNFLLTNAFSIQSSSTITKCTEQDLKLNFMFTVGAMLTNVSALAIGRVLDVYGPKVCGLIGAFFLYVACFIFIYAKDLEGTIVDPYLTGYALLALGGPFAYISSFQLSNSFPKKSGLILALITGAFDASSAVFLIYKVFYQKTNGAFTLAKFFKLYLLVPLFITIVQFTVMPASSYSTDSNLCIDDEPEVPESTSTPTEHAPLLMARRDSIGDALKQPYVQEGEETLIQNSGGVFGILHGHSAEFQLKTPWFYLACMFSTICMMRLNYFVATIASQYTYLLGSVSEAERLNKIFDIVLPLGGVISIPFVGMFIDNCSTVVVLTGTLAISLAIGVLGLFGYFWTGLANVALFVAYRPLFYTFVSDFCAKVFGFETFGTVYGSIICISGLFNIFQSYFDKLTHSTFKMNPIPINLVLVSLTAVIGVATVIYVKIQAASYNERKNRVIR